MFEYWRATQQASQNWGLAWFLANEFCERFYSSHGIVPQVIDHDGLGYYGIQLGQVPCEVNGKEAPPLGRLTMFGNVENWRQGGPGDHGLHTIILCDAGVPTNDMIEQAVRHMNLPALPEKTHARCSHKRRGASYELVFKIATIVALRGRPTAIWNHSDNVTHFVAQTDPQSNALKHVGAFVFQRGEQQLLIAGDGRVLGSMSHNLWLEYMRGKDLGSLVQWVENMLDGPESEGRSV